MPGGFHPFHAGHYALYKSALEAFPQADVYVAATNDQSERPFPFSIKEKLAKLAGVKQGRFVQVKSPFQAKEITQNYDPNSDVLIFVRSEKDKTEQPKPGGTKKDGSPAYFQPWTGKDLQPFSKHAYIAYLPTVTFGPGIQSATEIRKAWPTLDDRRKTAMVMSLYPATQKNPKLAQNVVQLLDMGMGGQEGVAEGWKDKVGAAALAGSMALGGQAHAGPIGNAVAQGLGAGIASAAVSSVANKSRNARDTEFAKQIPDEADRAIYLKALKHIKYSRAIAHSDPALMGANAVSEIKFKKLKQAMAEKYNIQMPVKEQGLAEAEDVFMQDPESDKILRYAQQHYPNAQGKQQAFMKFVQRALMHSKEEDETQDEKLEKLEQMVNKLADQLNKVNESTDYIEEK